MLHANTWTVWTIAYVLVLLTSGVFVRILLGSPGKKRPRAPRGPVS